VTRYLLLWPCCTSHWYRLDACRPLGHRCGTHGCRSCLCNTLLAALALLYSTLGPARRMPSSWLLPRHTWCRSPSRDAVLAALALLYGTSHWDRLDACHPLGYRRDTHGYGCRSRSCDADRARGTRYLLLWLCGTPHWGVLDTHPPLNYCGSAHSANRSCAMRCKLPAEIEAKVPAIARSAPDSSSTAPLLARPSAPVSATARVPTATIAPPPAPRKRSRGGLPAGWARREVRTERRTYPTFHGPNGETARSCVEAWRVAPPSHQPTLSADGPAPAHSAAGNPVLQSVPLSRAAALPSEGHHAPVSSTVSSPPRARGPRVSHGSTGGAQNDRCGPSSLAAGGETTNNPPSRGLSQAAPRDARGGETARSCAERSVSRRTSTMPLLYSLRHCPKSTRRSGCYNDSICRASLQTNLKQRYLRSREARLTLPAPHHCWRIRLPHSSHSTRPSGSNSTTSRPSQAMTG